MNTKMYITFTYILLLISAQSSFVRAKSISTPDALKVFGLPSNASLEEATKKYKAREKAIVESSAPTQEALNLNHKKLREAREAYAHLKQVLQ